jgi:hypothetical protein
MLDELPKSGCVHLHPVAHILALYPFGCTSTRTQGGRSPCAAVLPNWSWILCVGLPTPMGARLLCDFIDMIRRITRRDAQGVNVGKDSAVA